MTCKDCICYGVCTFHVKGDENKRCQNFKDKSRIVELPCKVGQTLYAISQMKDKRILPFVNEYEATFLQVGKRKCKVYHEMDGFIKIFLQDDFGKTVFLTREEAEEALRKAVEKDADISYR